MITRKTSFPRLAAAAVLALLAGSAAAHPGHGAHGFLQGLQHPFGLDHLLAMVAVGVWSVAAWPDRRRWRGPLAFLAAMAIGALFGIAGVVPVPLVEAGVAASVLAMGLLLAGAGRLPPAAGLATVALGGLCHGLAHGAEWPAGAAFASYAAGFFATTALLHAGGVVLGLGLERVRGAWTWRATGALLGAAGLALLARI